MRVLFYLLLAAFLATVALGQAITGFSGGQEYDSYYGGLTNGDVIGYRFTVSEPISLTDLGIWNVDQTGSMESPHDVGIWDDSQVLLTSVTVENTGTVMGDYIYVSVTPIELSTGITYTIGAVYFSGDDDWYISGATGVTSDPSVTWLNSVYAASIDLGLVYPTLDSPSSSGGRFGPNFLLGEVSLQRSTWGAIKASW